MASGKVKINKLNIQNKDNHSDYLKQNSELITSYQNKKDDYNNNISIINAEKVSMRDELRKLYDFLRFVGGTLDKKISIIDFVEESPAPNISEEVEPAVQEEYSSDLFIIGDIIDNEKARKYEKNIYWKTLDYKKNLKKKEQAVSRMKDCVEIAIIYRNMLVTLKDSIREKIIPEFEYIKAFLIADAIREKYISGGPIENIKPCNITEYKGTKYNIHYQFVKNTFDFLDLCKAFFSRPLLTELMGQEEITDEQREEFNQSIYAIQDKLVLLESDMEVKH